MQTVLEYVACKVFTMFLNKGLLGRLAHQETGRSSAHFNEPIIYSYNRNIQTANQKDIRRI